MFTAPTTENATRSLLAVSTPKSHAGRSAAHSTAIRAEAVLTLITDMLRAIAEYSKNDRAEFIRTVQETQAAQQTADISKKRTTAGRRPKAGRGLKS